jgi:uncharacterized sulfatase
MHHGATTHMRGYRTPQWKLMRDFASEGRAEFYNLTKDPAEMNNLIDSKDPLHIRIRRRFDKLILERMAQINDPQFPASR